MYSVREIKNMQGKTSQGRLCKTHPTRGMMEAGLLQLEVVNVYCSDME